MMRGPALFVAQYLSDEYPFNNLENISTWASSMGYKGIQIPCDKRLIDIERAEEDQEYCDNIVNMLKKKDLVLTELSTHSVGQLIAVHPAYDSLMDTFAPEEVRGNPEERVKWATEFLKKSARASKRLGTKAQATFSGSLAWPYFFPYPQRPEGMIEIAFTELAKRWKPILDVYDQEGIDACYELHPGMDLHDGVTFELFLRHLNYHPRANILYDPSHMVVQQMDYLTFIDHYHDRIKAVHVKDAEYHSDGRQGVYGGYSNWVDRAGRFRALGEGQIDFKKIFSKLAQYGFNGWAVHENECCLKDPVQCAEDGVAFINNHIIKTTDRKFDDFLGGKHDKEMINKMLGL
ncbi:Inosose dehydratase [Acrasis kona]|uniref:Inosose dehydratase n=1 Tax=Acrasis kona TaxID=1008807 RepID=A0AAW2YL93_9EUKA